MRHSPRSPLSFSFLAALMVLCFPRRRASRKHLLRRAGAARANAPRCRSSASRADSDAVRRQLKKIDGWIADQGREIAITPIITDILGLTKGDQTISCRAFAAEGEGDEVHQIYVLPEGKGYLEAILQDKLDVYWADKDFALKAALEGVRGQMPAPTTFADAQYGFSFEVAWWAKYTDAH